MSEVIVQPTAPNSISVTQGTPVVVTIDDPVTFPLTIQTGGTFVAPAYYLGINQILGTTNQISATTIANICTLTIPSSFTAPYDITATHNLNVGNNAQIDNNLTVTQDAVVGTLEVNGNGTFHNDVIIDTGYSIYCDIGGDLQGTLPNPTVHRIKNIDIHNTPADGDLFQYQSGNNKYHWVTLAEAGIAAASHTHAATDITSGTIAFARLPTGTTSSTVAIGNHTHSGADITSGTIGFSYLPTGTGASQVAIGNHTHTMADITDLREQKIFVECECNAAGEFSSISLNSGTNSFTGTGLDTTGGHYGILTAGTSTTNNAVAGLGSGDTTTATVFGTFKIETTAILMIPNLSTSGERFFIESGWTDNRTGVPTDGVLIQYCDNVNSGKFIGLAYNNTTLSSVDLGITVAANTWYKLNIVVNINGSVDFYIDGVLKGSLASGSAPTGSTRATSLSHTIRKSAGTTARSLYLDYINYIVWCSR